MQMYVRKPMSPLKCDYMVFATKTTKSGVNQGFPYVQGYYLVSNEDKLRSAVPCEPTKFDSMYELYQR